MKEGGPELSLGWYVIDVLLDFMGQSATSVYADYDNYTSPGSPFMDCGKMVLRLKNGAMASWDMYFCHRIPYPTWELEVAGPKGVIRVQAAGDGTADTVRCTHLRRRSASSETGRQGAAIHHQVQAHAKRYAVFFSCNIISMGQYKI